MRYRYEEYSPQNKRQYVIAVGVHELRAMFAAIQVVNENAPHSTREQKDFKKSLASSLKGLSEAIKEAERLEDDGKRRNAFVGADSNETR